MLVVLNRCADPFEERKRGAGDEDENRRQERPEERLLAVSVRVRFVGHGVGEVDPDQQEHLVDGIGDGVASLGQERRAARDDPGDELADRDSEIRHHRRQHCRLALALVLALRPRSHLFALAQ